ncbi:MAG: hypothetical protein G3M70_06825 [Candidatus Nitronauta litoralis]|uniref:Hint domain-containing protein n=1 Tax=Candidatus Nitronauta litoralis TaxID=2705533 RepID=A0A7T0BVG2_9BACT|nr:MAG: hypothetical protein G3M70_06825 [Candidatus Nitronauta litoralis]
MCRFFQKVLPSRNYNLFVFLFTSLLFLIVPTNALLAKSTFQQSQAKKQTLPTPEFSAGTTGSSTFSLPLRVPPGTRGMQPELEIVYDSDSDNGYLGLGLFLNGLSEIRRCPATLAQDGFKGTLNYDEDDRFCLDGNGVNDGRLKVISGNYGADGSEYRTERDTFRKIVARSKAGSGPASFDVWLKDGTYLQYGTAGSNGSRVMNSQGKGVRIWALNSVTDRNGNYYFIKYTGSPPDMDTGENIDSPGQYYPEFIYYTGHQNSTTDFKRMVQFKYIRNSYPSQGDDDGGWVETNALLKEIVTCISESKNLDSPDSNCETPGTRIATRYKLSYEENLNYGTSIVRQIEECDANDVCLPPVTLHWDEGTSSFGSYSDSSLTVSDMGYPSDKKAKIQYPRLFGDVNGDGHVDFCRAVGDATRSLSCALGGKDEFSQPYWPSSSSSVVDFGVWDTPGELVDVNGDGRDDFCRFIDKGNGYSQLSCALATESGFSDGKFKTPDDDLYTSSSNKEPRGFFDVNGDGRADYCRNNEDKILSCEIATSQGFAWNQFQSPENKKFVFGSNDRPQAFTDVNGDGRADYCRVIDKDNNKRVACALALQSGFEDSGFESPVMKSKAGVKFSLGEKGEDNPWNFGDVNGDGRSDFCRTVKDSKGNKSLKCALAQEDSFGSTRDSYGNVTDPIEILYPGPADRSFDFGYSIEDGFPRIFTDMNGDGLVDYCRVVGYPYYLSCAMMGIGTYGANASPSPNLQNKNYPQTIQDVTGNGKGDYCAANGTTENASDILTCMQGISPLQKVVAVDNGIGGITRIDYKPLTDQSVYRFSGQLPDYPIQKVEDSQYVVSASHVSDGQGNTYDYSYFYENATTSLSGLGNLGFRARTKADPQLGSKNTTVYKRDFPDFNFQFKTLVDQNLLCNQDTQNLSDTSPCVDTPKNLLTRTQFYYKCVDTLDHQECDNATKVARVEVTTKSKEDFGFGYKQLSSFAYDRFGNQTQISDYGDINQSSHFVSTCSFYQNDETNWQNGFLLYQKISTNPTCPEDQSAWETYKFNNKSDLSFKQNTYDTGTMNRSTSLAWDNQNNMWLGSKMTYDSVYGNLVRQDQMSGNPARLIPHTDTHLTYESTFNTFPLVKTSPPPDPGENASFKLTESYAYDARFGSRVAVTDVNGKTSTVCLDSYGRVEDTQGPMPGSEYGAIQPDINCLSTNNYTYLSGPEKGSSVLTLSHMERKYTQNDNGTPSGYSQKIKTRETWNDGDMENWHVSKVYYDGLKRDYKTTAKGDDGQWIITEKLYKAQNLPWKQTLPYFEGAPEKYWIEKDYDSQGRSKWIKTPYVNASGEKSVTKNTWSYQAGNTIVTTANSEGNPDSNDNPRYIKSTVFSFFNSQRRTVSMEINDAPESVTKYDYTPLAQPSRVTLPNGVINKVTFDSLGRKTTLEETNMGVTRFFYTPRGTLGHTKDAKGQTIHLEYDNLNRLKREAWENAQSEITKTVGYTLDVVKDSDQFKNTLGRLVHAEIQDKDGNKESSKTYGYTPYGKQNAIKVDIPKISQISNSSANRHHTFKMRYNPKGRMTRYQFDDGTFVESRYSTGGGNLKDIQYNGNDVSPAPAITYSNFNALGQPQNTTSSNRITEKLWYYPMGNIREQFISSPDSSLLNTIYEWDRLNNVTDLFDCNFTDANSLCGNNGTSKENFSQHLIYENNRLITANAPGQYNKLSFEYDWSGNIIRKDGLDFEYTGNQFRQDTGGHNYIASYDDNGNMEHFKNKTIDQTLELTYDVKNQLKKLEGAGDAKKYTYDYTGSRIIQESASVTTFYPAPFYEISVFSGTVQHTKYLMGPGGKLVAFTVNDSGEADPPVGVPQPGTIFHFHKNQVGSVALVTNHNGEQVSRVFYKPYGEIFRPDANDNHFRPKFNGKELDEQANLYYFSARYYNPVIGRFLTADTRLGGKVFTQDAFNRYAFALNNPVTFADPTGHGVFKKIWKGIKKAGHFIKKHIKQVAMVAVGVALVAAEVAADVVTEGAATPGLAELDAEILGDVTVDATADVTADVAGDTAAEEAGEVSAEDAGEAVSEQEAESVNECGGCSCANSFTGDSLVQSENGPVAISKIRKGMRVKAYDEKTGEIVIRQVTEVTSRTTQNLIVLHIGDVAIETTANHPFWVEGKGWVVAGKLKEGNLLKSLKGNPHKISRIEQRKGAFKVHNFEVEGAHNYFVSEKQLLVHNPIPIFGPEQFGGIQPMAYPAHSYYKNNLYDEGGNFLGIRLTGQETYYFNNTEIYNVWEGPYRAGLAEEFNPGDILEGPNIDGFNPGDAGLPEDFLQPQLPVEVVDCAEAA